MPLSETQKESYNIYDSIKSYESQFDRRDPDIAQTTYLQSKSSDKREYFSGANVRVYFGDIWVDQLTAISFSLEEQVAPIYGFSSYTFDRISRGSRMVQGQFTINFTENGYMQSILNRISDSMRTRENRAPAPAPNKYIRDNSELDTIKDLLSINSRETYLEQVNALKSSFWGSSGTDTSSLIPLKEHDTYFYTQDRNGNSELRKHGFNILIDYSPDANQKDFQDCLNDMNTGRSSYQTYRNIIGVHIGGEGQAIMNNGQVISQTYQFIGMDLDGDITRPSLFAKKH